MNLHRSDSKPDWANIKPADMNAWQKLSAKSNGILTPGNIISVIGFGLVIYGLTCLLNENYMRGLVFVLVGRAADVLDGWASETTQTKSPLGEIMDASIDKLGVLFTFIALFIAGIAPYWVLALLVAPQLINTVVGLKAFRSNKRIHPSKSGKLSMAALLVSLLAFMLIKAVPLTNNLYLDGAIVIAALSATLGFYSSIGYIRGNSR